MSRQPKFHNNRPVWREKGVTAKEHADLPELDFKIDAHFQEHDWRQGGPNAAGDELVCPGLICNVGHRHGHRYPGYMLVGTRGNWSLVKEGGTVRLKP